MTTMLKTMFMTKLNDDTVSFREGKFCFFEFGVLFFVEFRSSHHVKPSMAEIDIPTNHLWVYTLPETNNSSP